MLLLRARPSGKKTEGKSFQRKARPIKLGKILNAADFTPLFSVAGACQALPGWPGLSLGRATPSGCSCTALVPQIRLQPLL